MSEQKNNFDKKVQMHLACSKNELRKEMQCVYFKDGFAYASDGIILVKNRISEISGLEECEAEALNGKFLHADLYKDIYCSSLILKLRGETGIRTPDTL